MERKKVKQKSNKNFVVILLVLLLGITIGYASLATVLTINGSTQITKASWDIHFENVEEIPGSITATSPARIITEARDKIAYGITLRKMGEFYEFTADVVNAGTIDAKLNDTYMTGLTPEDDKYLNYTVTYADGSAITTGAALNAGDRTKIRVRVEYDPNIISEDNLPKITKTLDLEYRMNYVQK